MRRLEDLPLFLPAPYVLGDGLLAAADHDAVHVPLDRHRMVGVLHRH